MIKRNSFILLMLFIGIAVYLQAQSDKPRSLCDPKCNAMHLDGKICDRIDTSPRYKISIRKGSPTMMMKIPVNNDLIISDSFGIVAERDSCGKWKIKDAERALETIYKLYFKERLEKWQEQMNAPKNETIEEKSDTFIHIFIIDTPKIFNTTTYNVFTDKPSATPIYYDGDTIYYLSGSLKDLPVKGNNGGNYYPLGEQKPILYSGDTINRGIEISRVLILYTDTLNPMYLIGKPLPNWMKAYKITHCFTLGYKQPCPYGGEDRCIIYYTDENNNPLKKSIIIWQSKLL